MESHHHPMSHAALHLIRSTNALPTEDDAVRVAHIEGHTVSLDSACWPLPGWPGVEVTHNKRDHALACALSFHGADWPEPSHMCTTEYYTDAHGTWCTGCGNSVWSAEDGEGMVCSSPTCEKYDPQRLPVWVKEMKSIA